MIAGIVIAFVAGVLSNTNRSLEHWAAAHNPFFEGEYSDLLSMIPFALIALVLWAVGRELWLKPERAAKRA